MKTKELKRIVKENRYEMIENDFVIFIYGYSHGGTDEFKTEIRISKLRTKDIDIKTGIYCEVEEFNVIKAAVEFAETAPEDREKDKENRPNWMTRWLGEPVRDCEVEVEE